MYVNCIMYIQYPQRSEEGTEFLELRFQMTVSRHMPLKEQVLLAAELPIYHLSLSYPTPSIVCMCVFETGFLCVALAVPNQVGFELRDLPVSSSQVLGLKPCATTVGLSLFSYIRKGHVPMGNIYS